jgi:two-component system LytT family response regulator
VKPRAFVVDDEPLAVKRLVRLLEATGRVVVTGTATDPAEAVAALAAAPVDLLFLDIQMPGMDGFELVSRLAAPPLVVFTTAHDEHALAAFRANAIDYLLKPVRAEDLERALAKLDKLSARPDLPDLLARLQGALAPPERIASRLGDRTKLVELAQVTHFQAEDKLTIAVTEEGRFVVDPSIGELADRLEARGFFRIHRAVLVNLSFVAELHAWIGGALRVRLKDKGRTELTVARDRARALKLKLGA